MQRLVAGQSRARCTCVNALACFLSPPPFVANRHPERLFPAMFAWCNCSVMVKSCHVELDVPFGLFEYEVGCWLRQSESDI